MRLNDGFVFTQVTDGTGEDCISYKRARDILDTAAAAAGVDVPKHNPHAFRKGRACYLARQDEINAFQLAQWMGWTDLDTARHYVRIVNADLQEAVGAVMDQNDVSCL